MATVYHFQCKPAVDNSEYRTLNSRFDGTCNGCGQPYEKDTKIAYFSDGSRPATSTAPAGKDNSGEVAALRNELNQLKKDLAETRFVVKKTETLLVDLNSWILIAGDIDWKSLPMKERSKPKPDPTPEPTATPKQVAKEFKGKLIEPSPAAGDEEDSY